MEDTHKSKPEPEAAFKEAFAPTDPADPRAVFVLTVDEVQKVARDILGKDLTDDDVHSVIEGVNYGMAQWYAIVAPAICEVLGVRREILEIPPDMEQRSIETLHGMSARREALKMVYERIIAQLQGDPFERLIFIQCFAALDASEGHCLAGIYTDEFNRTLIQYQEAKEP